MISGKIWGMSQAIEQNHSLEFHRAKLTPGGICSKHKHLHRWNGFYVESGLLKLVVWQTDYPLVDTTILGSGDYTKVPPGLYHQFECLQPTILFEIYWVELGLNDIERESPGRLEDWS